MPGLFPACQVGPFRERHCGDGNFEFGRAQAVSKHIQSRVVLVVIAMIGAGFGLMAMLRIQEAKEFSQPHQMQTDGGTNYVIQLTEAVVGKTKTGCILMLYLRLENPNPFDVTLGRNWFILVGHSDGHDIDQYRLSATGTQPDLIKLPANGVLDREMLSFTVPDDAFADSVALRVGRSGLLLVKDPKSFKVRLRDGEFRSFRRRRW
jgi:hypothetical protein